MTNPVTILSGKLHLGKDCEVGENVVVNVAEEAIFGDRCVIPNNAYLSGRSLQFGSDFYGYSWDWRRLDVGRGRRDYEAARLVVGDRCTFHDNRIDLTKAVAIGIDVGLSPEVVVYTHGYWLSELEGYPCNEASVAIGDGVIVGFRSVVLPGTVIERRTVVGAQSVVSGTLSDASVYAGNPAKLIRNIVQLPVAVRVEKAVEILTRYARSLEYRWIDVKPPSLEYPVVNFRGVTLGLESGTCAGEEDRYTDDLRDFLFRRGLRFYTQRRFRSLEKR